MGKITRMDKGGYSPFNPKLTVKSFTRNHRRTWYIGAELHADGLNLDDQR